MKTLSRIFLLSLVLLTLVACGREEAPPTTDNPPAAATDPAGEASQPVVISGAGDISATLDAFRQALGGSNNGGAPGPHPAGFRQINWDGVPDDLAAPNFLPADFFNAPADPRARGAFFSTPGEGIQVSAKSDNPGGTAVRFGHINPSYADAFKTFSEERLFSPVGSNVVDMTFFVPGTNTPAVVTGFGAVYTDVDTDHTAFEYFDAAGNSLGQFATPIAGQGLSFLGVVFPEPIVARVQIKYGTDALGPDDGNGIDVAVMDDFIYGEPQAMPGATTVTAGTFAAAIPGSEAFVGLVRAGNQVMAYVCDAQALGEWFVGQVQSDSLDLTSRNGARLQATFAGEGLSGAFTPAGEAALPFTAGAVSLPAGLFRSEGVAEGLEYIGGLIILPGGQYRGLAVSGTQKFIVDPDPLDIQNGTGNLLADVDWGDGIIPLPFTQVKINE